MTSYITITDAETDPEAPLTSELAKKWRDNPIAIAKGDATAPKIQMAALVTDSTAISWVASRNAGVAVGAVGSYAFVARDTDGTSSDLLAGTTYAGSLLTYAGFESSSSGSVVEATYGSGLSGTWRAMGHGNSSEAFYRGITLALRIS